MSSTRRLANRYDLVLLGTIMERPASGYDILTFIRDRELDRWAHISTSTIYARLLRLERHGQIEGRSSRDGNRPDGQSRQQDNQADEQAVDGSDCTHRMAVFQCC